MTGKTFGNLFLSVGAMKAGTTWLYAVLSRHPALHVTLEKELHYFYHRYVNDTQLSEAHRLREVRNRYLLRFDPAQANIDRVRENLHWITAYLDRPVDDFWYRNLFQMRPHQMYACDFSNLHAHLPATVWPRIMGKCDQLRVLFTMRDPLTRLWSHVKFQAQLNGQLEELPTWGATEMAAFARRPHIWRNTEYGVILRNLRTGLPDEVLKLLFFEDVHHDQHAALRDIEGFLGLMPFEYPEAVLNRRFTESARLPLPGYFADLFAADIARIIDEVRQEGLEPPVSWFDPARSNVAQQVG